MGPSDAVGTDDAGAVAPPSAARPVALAAVAGAWGAALLVSYLVAHPDVLRLPASLAAIGAASAVDAGRVGAALGRDAWAVAVAVAVLLACYGVGRVVGRLVPESDLGPVAVEAAKLALGLGVVAVVTFLLGKTRLLYPATAVAVIVGGVACLAVSLRAGEARSGAASILAGVRRAAADRLVWPWAALVAVVAVGVAATALAPPTARDALTYHLAVPKAYVAAHAIVEIPQNVYCYLPFSTEMLYTLGLLLGSAAAAALVHALVGLVVLAVVYSYGARIGGAPRWGALAAALCATIPTAGWTAGFAHNETIRSLALTIAVAGVARWYAGGARGALVWAGVALGLALSAKHTELVLLPAFALVVLLRLRSLDGAERTEAMKTVAVAALVGSAFPLPWYLQNVAWTGNPLYPYFWSLFPTHSSAWTAERAEMFESLLRTTYGETGALGQLRLPWDVSVLGRDELPRGFDGVLGPAFLLLAPFVAWLAVRRDGLDRFARIAALVVALGFVAWASQSQQIRFLVALAPAAAVVGVATLASRSMPRACAAALAIALGAIALANVLVYSANVATADPVRAAVGLEDRDAYLDRRLGYTPFYRAIDETPPDGGRVMLVDTRNDTFYIDAPVYADYVFEDATIGRVVNRATTPDEIARELGALGVTRLLVRHDILLDPNFTPFLTSVARYRYDAFLESHARLVRGDETFALYDLIP